MIGSAVEQPVIPISAMAGTISARASAAYHLFPKHDHAYEMFRGRPNRIKPAPETSDTVH